MSTEPKPAQTGITAQEAATRAASPSALRALREQLPKVRVPEISPDRLATLMALYQIPSAYALEKKSGVSQATIRRFLLGKIKLRAESLMRLASVFTRHAAEFK